jgi:hypothetical protein
MSSETESTRRLLRITAIAVPLLAVFAAIGLEYVRPDIFQFSNALPATLTYFGLFGILVLWARKRFRKSRRTRPEEVLPSSPSKASSSSPILGELALIAALATLSAGAGAASGIAWWCSGGFHTHTLVEALYIGAAIGALTAIVVLAGP